MPAFEAIRTSGRRLGLFLVFVLTMILAYYLVIRSSGRPPSGRPFFSLGAGTGIMLTYGSYLPRGNVVRS